MNIEELPNLETVYGIPLKLSVQLPTSRQSTKNILRFEKGTIVELGGLASEPVNLCINGKTFARGEVVQSEGNLGIKITEIITGS